MDAKQAFDAGELPLAIDLQTQVVKSKPMDTAARTALFELLCFAGEWERAEKQLAVLDTGEANVSWGISVYQNLIHAERKRLKVFKDGIAPDTFLEVMLMRDYAWVPWQHVKSLTIDVPKNPRDLLWTPAQLVLTDDIERNCYLPCQYANSGTASNNQTRLGRLTEFTDGSNGPIRGLGQHLLVAGEQDFGLLEVRNFEAT